MTRSTDVKTNPKTAQFLETYGILIVVLAMMGALAIKKPEVFLTPENLSNILKQNASLALLALGMLVVIITGGIDLSVGSTMALAMVTIAIASNTGVNWGLCLVIGPVIGLLVGWINGAGLTYLRLPHPFIMTLGTLNVARGLTYLVTGGAPVSGLQPEIRYLGTEYWGLGIFPPPAGLPVSLLVVTVCSVGLWFFLQRTSVGRHIYAIGGNPQAARVSGVNVDRVLIIAYMICGFFAGLAGL
jgi:ribose/xylose/arabinose/galactoside ABC-type transport system permease subunit